MVIFRTKDAIRKKIKAKARAYIWLINLIGIPKNNSKDCKKTIIVVFRIEVNTSNFSARFLKEKLNKAIKAIKKMLKKTLISFTDI